VHILIEIRLIILGYDSTEPYFVKYFNKLTDKKTPSEDGV